MSEYQYYEFLTIDQPLTEQEQVYLRSLSRRVELTPTRAVFTYSYGDFRGDPLRVLEAHFDALLYLANWGSKQLAFRFPRSAIDRESLMPYCGFEEISLTMTEQHVVLDISFHEQEGMGWIEGEGVLATLTPLRHDILRGDLRTLYLAWLKAAQYTPSWYVDLDELDEEDVDDEELKGKSDEDEDLLEPPVPTGLNQLSASLQAFVELFEIDADLVAVAAEASPPLGTADDQIEQWISMLPEAERNAFLVRVARSEPHVDVQLLRRLRQIGGRTYPTQTTTPRRKFTELLAAAERRKQQREEQERQEAERARLRKLETLAQREPEAWAQVRELIAQKHAKAYDEAVRLLVELRDLAHHSGRRADFDAQISTIKKDYHNRPALLARLQEAGITQNA
jgi:hypothetical protein